MPNDETDGALPLPDLRIRNFRGIREIDIPRLGRVTLITGKNSVGKTTILEACRVYAARGRLSVLRDLLQGREEYDMYTREEGDKTSQANLASIFHGRDVSELPQIKIGPRSGPCLTVEVNRPNSKDMNFLEQYATEEWEDSNIVVMRQFFQNRRQITPLVLEKTGNITGLYNVVRPTYFRSRRIEPVPTTTCITLGPGLMDNHEIAEYLDRVTLTEDENRAVEALNLVLGGDVERIAMVEQGRNRGPTPRFANEGRRAVVKLRNLDRPVPLKSLGDGATRLFGVALALANCRDGFLLIDEAENGIHYTVQADYWRLVFNMAKQNNVQVLATTHSWDCVEGFAQAAVESEASEGFLFRVGRNVDRVWPVGYSERELQTVAEQGIEVR